MTTYCNEHASTILKGIFKSADQSHTYVTLKDAFPVEYAEAIRELEDQYREIKVDDLDDIQSGVIAIEAVADPATAQMVIDAPVGADNGRSAWMWFRLANGDLILGCWPRAETYEATEADPGRP